MKTKEEQWLEVFLPLYEEARPLVQKVGRSVRNESPENTVLALEEALGKMPLIFDKMKAIPNPKEKELKEIKKKFEKGFKEFIDSCKYGITYFKKPNVFNQTFWLEVSNSAAKNLEEATNLFSQYSNR